MEKREILYTFRFGDGRCKEIVLPLDLETLALGRSGAEPPEWALLGNHRCSVCPADMAGRCCPVAANMAAVVVEFRDFFAYEDVAVTVITPERSYFKETTVQEGLSALIGIIMVTSGCPAMEKLKPMVRFHLPFATLEETVFRMASMYLVSRYYRFRDGMEPDLSLDGLATIYDEVGAVNCSFAERLREAAKKDANVNALVNLHCFAEMVPVAAEDVLAGLEPYFSAYERD